MSKSDILKTIHEEVKGLYEIGLVDVTTMRKFDARCLEPTKKLTGEDVKRIRNKTSASQPVFAAYLNVTTSTVKQWELDKKKPSGASLRLLQLIDHEGLAVFEPIQQIEQVVPAPAKRVLKRVSRPAARPVVVHAKVAAARKAVKHDHQEHHGRRK